MSQRDSSTEITGLEIAIVGMACRFPGAKDADEFWENLKNGVESIKYFTDEELEAAGTPPELYRQPGFVPVARTIDEFDLFDAGFFGVSPREAEVLDPQQRLFLECSWEVLEDAGYDPDSYDGLIGIFAGSKLSQYMINTYFNPRVLASVGNTVAQTANDKDYVTTRVSYKLDLGGPSLNVQTACSTSLVAAHLAGQSLLSGECDLALAGGVSLAVPPTGYQYKEGDLYAKDGRIRAFDADASGTIFGSGLGLVALKRLEDALEDGDNVLAVIKGSAVNNDGSLKVGYTAPGADGQARVIQAAQTVAEVDPESISYVETHGTGTPTGDPIEISALTRVFREKTQKKGYCAIGSVKTNIGHLGAAAGVAGMIKTTLALKHRQIPPSLLFENPNPQIDFENSPFFVNTELRPWQDGDGPRRAGLSAFGIGGTNAHAILEEAPEPEPTTPSRKQQLLLISARTDTAVEAATANLAEHLKANPELDLADVAFTLQVGRKPFEQRRMLVASDLEDAAEALATVDPKRVRTFAPEGKERSVVFLFSGQGAQYPGMGRGLYESEPTFREAVDRCCEILEPHLGLDLRDLLYPADDQAEGAAEELEQTRNTQPALFVIEYATAQLWREWGIEPVAMIGHSIGEYAAACLAGVFTLEEALALVAARGKLMQGLPAGSMLAVPLEEAELKRHLEEKPSGKTLSIAAINAPGRCVVSGPDDAVEAFKAALKEERVVCRPLHTSHAFHSGMMEPILKPFIEEVSKVQLRPPEIPYISNYTGSWVTEAEATDPEYWALHLRHAVRFADGAAELLREPRILIEVGPGNTLNTLTSRHPSRNAADHLVVSSVRHPKEKAADDLAFLLGTLGQIWLAGAKVDWRGFYRHEHRRRVRLPTYPFERRRFWIDRAGDLEAMAGAAAGAGGPRLRGDLSEWFALPCWKPSVEPAPLASAGNGSEEAERERWLLFADGEGVAERLAARLDQLGRDAVTVRAGDAFERLDDGTFTLAPGDREGYESLLAALADDGGVPRRIVHLWNLYGDRRELGEAQERAFYSPLFLAQALGKKGGEEEVHLSIVSSDLHRVAGTDGGDSHPEKAPLLGPAQVMAREYPKLRPVAVDLSLAGGGVDDAAVDALLAETAKPAAGAVVAYRGGERWLRDYESTVIDGVDPERLRFRQGGVYLITGGLGGFGLTFAEYLAREHGARLALLGRSALPPAEQWDGWLASHAEDDRTSRRIAKVRALEELGAEVLVLAADVTSEEQMARAVADTHERFGELHGVIHAAGLPGGGLMQLKTREMAQPVLDPKVAGTLALEKALGDDPLDFLVLCSSTIAVFGTVGQVDYCAANSFLDAYAAAAKGNGRYTVSINWGAWQEVGMAVETPAPGATPAAGAPADGAAGGGDEPFEITEPKPAAPDDAEVHPLLDRRLEGPEVESSESEAVYASDFSAERHWVLDEHRIMGNPAIPGTTYLEIVRAAYADLQGGDAKGDSRAEIDDLYFLQPLMTRPGTAKEGRVLLRKAGDGDAWSFRVISRDEGEEGEASWTEHARGKVGPAPEAEPASYDLDEIRARCSQEIDVAPGEFGAEKFVFWGPRWHSLKKIHLGEGEGMAQLELPAEFAADLDAYQLHPALVDVATALISGLTRGDNYLPLSYHKVNVHGRLPATVYSYLRLRGEPGGETVSGDVSILDESGRELVAIERFTMKKVGAARGRFAGQEAGKGPAGGQQGMFAEGGMKPEQGVEVLRRVLSRLRKPQVVVSPRDVAAVRRQLAEAGAVAAQAAPERRVGPESKHPRPQLSTPYVEPTNPTEERLVEVWQDVLGLEQVGIHDNFFDLGGDSVMGITVISQASEAGLELAPEQLFEHQTVAELAELLGAGAGAEGVEAAAEEEEDQDDAGLDEDELAKVLDKLDDIT